jgi:acyl carrier protein
MTNESVERIKALMASILEPRLAASSIAAVALTDDLDLRDDGIVDSLGFVQLIADLEIHLGPIDLADLEPEQLTNVGALARHIAGSGSFRHV